ncbi:tRNA(Ile)-lysidine synthetase [Parvibaculum lavamentivorans DS-1]|uniref:tRNA(Ile)-lysidine synthase n=1 Tax=Parvibaculum lavamentivorans (strain DS-1 / DSM 13023 / NCIMB 13966) TaxID=402881 RepID=A7HV06_PARL1|nr:tRNA lysidine(34) synthetase TilS [Parvibaculum lavamentivorans]ABS63739.1 tRNA(Ile)-lysidine synthetase [Parvibaculum lavamentivorans DS-1]
MSAQDKTARTMSSPVSPAEFSTRLSVLKPSKKIAIAFSGGPDSLALLILAAEWAKKRRGISLVAFTVDHGLRAASAAEAKAAARLSDELGVPHRTLKWRGVKPAKGIQAAARDARYALLLAACRSFGAGDLLVAHHLEDQAETFLLRLARGSGVDGLAAMPRARPLSDEEPAVRLLRPLIDLPRSRLLATVARAGLTAIHDPSNENERFDRVKARKALALLAPLGLDAARLARTAEHMARARLALEDETAALLRTHAVLSSFGHVEINMAAFLAAPAEIGLRVLGALCRIVGGGGYGPRMEGLEEVYQAAGTGTLGKGRTLHGVKLAASRGSLVATRELEAAKKSPAIILKAGEEGLWDRRFDIRLKKAPRGAVYEVRALGSNGLAALKAAGIPLPKGQRSILLPLPGLWREGRLAIAPHLGTLDPAVQAEANFHQGGFAGRG